MDWIANNTFLLIVIFSATGVGLALAWSQTGNKKMLYFAAPFLALAVAVFVIGRVHVSPEQQVKAALFAVAESIEQGDVEATVSAFVPEAIKEREAVRHAFRIFKIDDISIKNNLKITVTQTGRRATAEFNVTAMASTKQGGLSRKVPLFFIVHYEKDGNDWLIDSYEQMSAEKGFQKPQAR